MKVRDVIKTLQGFEQGLDVVLVYPRQDTLSDLSLDAIALDNEDARFVMLFHDPKRGKSYLRTTRVPRPRLPHEESFSMNLDVDGAIWVTKQPLPEGVKITSVMNVLRGAMRQPHIRLGSTFEVCIPKPFEPSEDLFHGVIGWDSYGPIFESPYRRIVFTWMRTHLVNNPA